MSRYSIIKLIPYFGQWPEWINFYIESCKANPNIDWLFFTDCPEPENKAPNVRYKQLSFAEYKQRVSEKLKINFNPTNPYKLCDLKPAYGFIHSQEIADYDYYAFGDIDIVYGNIRRFISDELLAKYRVISNHGRRLSGHFSLFHNTDKMRNAFRLIPRWQDYMESEQHQGIDESLFSKVFVRHKNHPLFIRKLWSLSSSYQRHVYFREQYSTILSPIPWWNGAIVHPQKWFWHQGRLTNDCDGDREFMYLHFMNWKSNKWLPKPLRSQPSAWMELDTIVKMDYRRVSEQGFQISAQGFTRIDVDAIKR